MKKNIILATLLLVALATGVGCKKDSSHPGSNSNFDSPSIPAPDGLEGNWLSGFVSILQLFDVYIPVNW